LPSGEAARSEAARCERARGGELASGEAARSHAAYVLEVGDSLTVGGASAGDSASGSAGTLPATRRDELMGALAASLCRVLPGDASAHTPPPLSPRSSDDESLSELSTAPSSAVAPRDGTPPTMPRQLGVPPTKWRAARLTELAAPKRPPLRARNAPPPSPPTAAPATGCTARLDELASPKRRTPSAKSAHAASSSSGGGGGGAHGASAVVAGAHAPPSPRGVSPSGRHARTAVERAAPPPSSPRTILPPNSPRPMHAPLPLVADAPCGSVRAYSNYSCPSRPMQQQPPSPRVPPISRATAAAVTAAVDAAAHGQFDGLDPSAIVFAAVPAAPAPRAPHAAASFAAAAGAASCRAKHAATAPTVLLTGGGGSARAKARPGGQANAGEWW
jgi:hypothetical protein